MSKFNKTVRSKHYWTAKGQGKIYQMLNENIKERGDAAKLAKKMEATPGYVSQILSGESEINPTWKKIVKFCLALDKVPVLEIKDVDEYLLEENLKASFKNHLKLFNACVEHETHQIKELEATNHFEINDCLNFIRPKNKVYQSEAIHIEGSLDEYELV